VAKKPVPVPAASTEPILAFIAFSASQTHHIPHTQVSYVFLPTNNITQIDMTLTISKEITYICTAVCLV